MKNICFKEVFILQWIISLNNACNLFYTENKRLDGFKFGENSGSSLYACAADCASYPVCESFNFLKADKICQLNYGNHTTATEDFLNDMDSWYGLMSNWKNISPCTHAGCNSTQKCSVLRNGRTVCEPIGCGPPPSKPNATATYVSDEPGSVATYRCETYYRSEGGVQESTCQLEGWQDVDPNCQRWMWYPSSGYVSLQAFREQEFHIQVRLSAINDKMIDICVTPSNPVEYLFYMSVREEGIIVVNSLIDGRFGEEKRMDFGFEQGVPFVLDIMYSDGIYKLALDNGRDLIFPERSSLKPYYFIVGNARVEYVKKY